MAHMAATEAGEHARAACIRHTFNGGHATGLATYATFGLPCSPVVLHCCHHPPVVLLLLLIDPEDGGGGGGDAEGSSQHAPPACRARCSSAAVRCQRLLHAAAMSQGRTWTMPGPRRAFAGGARIPP